jgi:hypothetical protein
MKLLKRLFCKHEYLTTTNLYGDIVVAYGGCRSIQECKHCGKIKFDYYLDEDCKEVNKL